MKVSELDIPGVLLIEPRVFRDPRGVFLETWNAERYRAAGIKREFVQDNVSISKRGVIRGLHYQHPNPQGKLVTVLQGKVFDVAVDVRRGSPTFGRWAGCELSSDDARQLFIPEGFAHGFAVLSDTAVFAYKCSDRYVQESEGTILWNDPEIGIPWPVENPVLSEKDLSSVLLREMPAERLPSL
jgi:dTDP-4-dehydrorhamnose 3,5-epimerase